MSHAYIYTHTYRHANISTDFPVKPSLPATIALSLCFRQSYVLLSNCAVRCSGWRVDLAGSPTRVRSRALPVGGEAGHSLRGGGDGEATQTGLYATAENVHCKKWN